MIKITKHIAINENEIEEEFVRSSGPGGQNVNKVSTAVKLRFDAINSDSLTPEIKVRLIRLAGRRAAAGGVIIITGQRYRFREMNRRDALDRLIKLIRKASEKPIIRRKTKPTAASREERLKSKQLQSKKKKNRLDKKFLQSLNA